MSRVAWMRVRPDGQRQRRCRHCQQWLPLDLFYVHNYGKSYDSYCKPCKKSRMAKRAPGTLITDPQKVDIAKIRRGNQKTQAIEDIKLDPAAALKWIR